MRQRRGVSGNTGTPLWLAVRSMTAEVEDTVRRTRQRLSEDHIDHHRKDAKARKNEVKTRRATLLRS